MPSVTSSMIGVDLHNPGSTALFALNTVVNGTDGSQWQYCIATGTLTTGMFVQISDAGTANAVTTAIQNAATVPMLIGVAQYTVAQGQYAFMAMRGQNLYVACSGTIPQGVELGLAPSSPGVLVTGAAAIAGSTMAGIFLEASASTATASIAQATLQWPRFPLVGTSARG